MASVTCLIGITIRNSSKIGIIHRPYEENGSRYGVTYFGSVECGLWSSRIDFTASPTRNFEYWPPADYEDVTDDEPLDIQVTKS